MAQQAAEAPIVNAWSAKSAVPFFRVGNYAPVFDELTTFDLPVEGAIPPGTQRLVFEKRTQPATRNDATLVHGRRHDPWRAARERARRLVSQSMGAYGEL